MNCLNYLLNVTKRSEIADLGFLENDEIWGPKSRKKGYMKRLSWVFWRCSRPVLAAVVKISVGSRFDGLDLLDTVNWIRINGRW